MAEPPTLEELMRQAFIERTGQEPTDLAPLVTQQREFHQNALQQAAADAGFAVPEDTSSLQQYETQGFNFRETPDMAAVVDVLNLGPTESNPFEALSPEDQARSLLNAGASAEADADRESQDADDSEIGIFDKAADVAGNAIGLAANTNFGQPKFSDRGVLGESNIVRDMRYPIDMFDDDGARLPNVISFEFFKKDYKTLKEEATQFATVAAGGLQTAVDVTRDVLEEISGFTFSSPQQYSEQIDAVDQATGS